MTTPIILAWRIPGTGEPGGLPSMGSHSVGHDWSDLAAAAEVLSRGDWDQSGLFSPFLKRKWEGARRSWSQRSNIPWGCALCELAALRFPRQQFRPARRGVPSCGDRRRARSVSAAFLLAQQSCPAAFDRALPPIRRHPARRAEPGKGTPAGVPASWRIGSRAKREGSGGRGWVRATDFWWDLEPVPCFWGLLSVKPGAGGKRYGQQQVPSANQADLGTAYPAFPPIAFHSAAVFYV